MTNRESLLRMAEWFRSHEFSPRGADGYPGPSCGCFVTAAMSAGLNVFDKYGPLDVYVRPIVGSFGSDTLRNNGWTGSNCTKDAEAVCLIAADLAA